MKSTDFRASLGALVTVRWGENVVATKHLSEGLSASVGADTATLAPIPCEPLGLAAVVVAEVRGGVPIAFVPRGAVGFRERPRMLPSPVAGPSEISLSAGDTVSYSIGEFLIVVTAEEAAKAPWTSAAPLSSALSPVRPFAVAALAHALLIGLSAQAAHAAAFEETGDTHEDLARYLAAADDRSRAFEQFQSTDGPETLGVNVNDHDGNGKDGGGKRAKGPEGAMGAEASRTKGGGHYTVSGTKHKEYESPVTREQALRDAREFGIAGLIGTDPVRGPIHGFTDRTAGPDAFDARGAMWATSIGETYGAGGLGLSGSGEGGGGAGEGIGLGDIGTIGHTFGRPGTGTGGGGGGLFGMGISGGSWWGGPWHGIGIGIGRIGTIGHGAGTGTPDWLIQRRERPEKVEEEGESRLPPHVIRRIVRANAGRFRLCYQGALLTNPQLAGGVTTRFLIGAGGAVKSAQNIGADLPDKTVVACVTRAFYGLVFPEPPDGRTVTVTYPLTFSPER